jgi:replicative DNA helicase
MLMRDQGLFNQEAEEALVGALFLEEGLVKDCTIQPDQIYSHRLRTLLSAIKSLDDKGRPIDVISVVEEIGVQNLEGIGGICYITELIGSVPTTANFRYYQDIVREYDQKRKVTKIASTMIMDAKVKDIGQIINVAGFKHLDRLTGGFQESDLVIIGARPSVGKTAFALNIALNVANDEMSLIFSLEMSRKQLLKRAAVIQGI